MEIVEEESDEALFWLEVAVEIGLITTAQAVKLSDETNHPVIFQENFSLLKFIRLNHPVILRRGGH
ncbi:hypothetical protein BH11BAC7_BH11BAC7_28290 [soil metagenome]